MNAITIDGTQQIQKSEPFLDKRQISVVTDVLKAAVPTFITLESIALIGIVDLELSGRISASAQAAVGLGDQLLYLTSTAASGLSVATCAVAARYFGAGNVQRMITTVKSSLAVSAICGIAAMFAGCVFAEGFVGILSTDPAVIKYGARYIQLCALGSLPYVVSIVVASIFRAIGRTAESLYLSIVTASVAIGLSYAFFNAGPLSGTLDALCLAWIIGAYVGSGIGLTVLFKRLKQSCLPAGKAGAVRRHEIRLVKLLFAIGLAVVLAESSTLATDFLVYKLLSHLPDATNLQAAWTIFLKVEETFAIMPISAISLAFAATVGQMIGQAKENDARKCLSILTIAASIVFGLIGCIVVAAPELVAVFTHADGAVFENSKQMLVLVPIFFPLLAVRLLAFSFLEGSGQTSSPMKLSLAGNAVKLALASFLLNVIALGAPGLIAAILVSRMILACGAVLAFKKSE